MTMPAAVLGSLTAGHGCWPPTTIVMGAPTVISGNMPASVLGNVAIPHTCIFPIPNPTHSLTIAMGSSTVIIEGMPAARVGDFMSCTDVIAIGEPTVIVG